MLHGLDYLLAALAALAAGAVNAIAGGGTLITFPTLTFLGVPAVIANLTNTVALCPGYFGGTTAQWNDLKTQKRRLWIVIPAGIVGGVLGGYLLLQTGERLFKELVPYLILLASGLLAIQDPVRAWLTRRMGEGHDAKLEMISWLPVGLASIYGGYFGAGLSVFVLSALGLTMEDSLTRLNALKQALLSVSTWRRQFSLSFQARCCGLSRWSWPSARWPVGAAHARPAGRRTAEDRRSTGSPFSPPSREEQEKWGPPPRREVLTPCR